MTNKLNEGETLFADGKIEEAEEYFLSIAESDSNNKEAYNNLGVIAFKKDETERAVGFFTRSLEIDPLYKDAIINYTDLLRKLNHLQIAVPFLEKVAKTDPNDKEISQILAESILKKKTIDEENIYNTAGINYLNNNEFEMAKDSFVKSLALNDNQPVIRERLLFSLGNILQNNSNETAKKINNIKPKFFDKEKEINTKRDLFLKYVPEELIPEKSGLNILFISDFEIAGNQSRMMKFFNNHTTHKARNIIFNKDYLNYGEDIVLNTEEKPEEAHALIKQADFFHFVRLVPEISGIEWNKYLRKNNCMIDFFGSEISRNKEAVVSYLRRTNIFGLNKCVYEMYKGAESLMYHFPTMFDSSEYRNNEIDLGFYEKEEIIIGHSPTNPEIKGTHYILPIIERVNNKVQQRVTVNLTMGKTNTEALIEKAKCDIYIDCLSTAKDIGGAGVAQNSHESIALGKVTICSMDNFYLSFYPDAPIFSSTIEDLEDLILNILENPDIVKGKMKNAKSWLKQFSPDIVMKRYLQIYQYIITGDKIVNSFDKFFKTLP